MTIEKIISEKRKSMGLTQQQLAEKLHVSYQAVSKWENGISLRKRYPQKKPRLHYNHHVLYMKHIGKHKIP